MLSAVAWLPRGAAAGTPKQTEPTEEEVEAMRRAAEGLEASRWAGTWRLLCRQPCEETIHPENTASENGLYARHDR